MWCRAPASGDSRLATPCRDLVSKWNYCPAPESTCQDRRRRQRDINSSSYACAGLLPLRWVAVIDVEGQVAGVGAAAVKR
jgi:hypothetical protein